MDTFLRAVVIESEWAISTTDLDFTNCAKVPLLRIHAPRK